MFFEELDECRGAGEIELLGNLLYCKVSGAQQHLGIDEHRFVYPFQYGAAGDAFYRCRQVFGSEVELFGIELYRAILLVVNSKQLEEAV